MPLERGGREGGREGEREGGRERGRGREGKREGGRKGSEGRRKGGARNQRSYIARRRESLGTRLIRSSDYMYVSNNNNNNTQNAAVAPRPSSTHPLVWAEQHKHTSVYNLPVPGLPP